MKTKHPQLLYESKLYRILQGGSNDSYLLNEILISDNVKFVLLMTFLLP